MKCQLIATAALALLAAAPASAQFSGMHHPKIGKGSFSNGANPQTLVDAAQGAKIVRVRAGAGPGQYRPTKVCDTDIAYGADDGDSPELTSRRPETYINNIEVYAGGFCQGGNRGKQ